MTKIEKESLEETTRQAEFHLKNLDDQIENLLHARGQLANRVQALWNRRHLLESAPVHA